MAQIQRGTNFISGSLVTDTNLNAHVDAAVLLPGAVTDQTAKTVPLGADSVLVYSAADNALRKSTLAQVGANMTLAARDIQVSGAVTGTASFNGSANINIVTTAAQTVPAGSVFNFAASTAPTGYLECSGAAVSRATYAALFAVTSTTFGVGDGSTTFNLPDLRGEFVRGFDAGRGVDSGRTFGSAQSGDVQPHTHPMTRVLTWQSAPLDVSNVCEQNQSPAGPDDYSGYRPNTDASTGTETRPRNIAMLYCIKT